MELTFVKALLSGDKNVIFGTGSALLFTFFGTWLAKYLITNAKAGIDAFLVWWNKWDLGFITAAGNKFAEKLKLAVDNTVHTQHAVTEALADNTITVDEWKSFGAALWEDFQDGMELHDWQDLGKLFIPGYSPKVHSIDQVKATVKSKVLSQARALSAETADRVIKRSLQRKLMLGQTQEQGARLSFSRNMAAHHNADTCHTCGASLLVGVGRDAGDAKPVEGGSTLGGNCSGPSSKS